MAWTSLCDFDELTEGRAKHVEIDGYSLAVFLYVGQPYVMDNTCPHAGHDMSEGYIKDGCAVCPYHLWNFQLKDGQMPGSPGVTIGVYKTRLYPRVDHPTLVQADLPMP
jgi:nitrite reductase/ring-hydroxylating ferredoxin subunit